MGTPQTIRIPLIGDLGARATSLTQDQRFVNGYFDVHQNQVTGNKKYYFVKREGLAQFSRPSGGNAVGRNMISWNGFLYSVFGAVIYKGTTSLVTMTTTTGFCDMKTVRSGATNQYLCVNDGVSLYLIATDDSVLILNNVIISTNTLANPTVITTATAHNLVTGNKIIIRGNITSVPSINDTIYTVTVTSPTTFTIPVNVTTAGTGGTLGIFPSPNTTDLVYMDGYFFTMKSDATVWQCNLDDPTTWDQTKFTTAMMDGGSGIGIGKQNNMLVAATSKAVQFYFDNANSTGAVISNVEQLVNSIGVISNNSIVHSENLMTWLSQSSTGGFAVYRLEGLSTLKKISTSSIERILRAEGTNITSARAFETGLRTQGHFMYVLTLTGSGRTFVYQHDEDIWCEYSSDDGATHWPIVEVCPHANTILAMHETNGRIYTLSSTTYQDDSINFTVIARTERVDFGTMKRKFCNRFEIVGDRQSSTANVLVSYSDDDYITLSDSRTFDMSSVRAFQTRFGNFRRRAWQLSYTGNTPMRIEAIEMDIEIEGDEKNA